MNICFENYKLKLVIKCMILFDQVYTRALTQVNTNQHESDTSQHESTRF